MELRAQAGRMPVHLPSRYHRSELDAFSYHPIIYVNYKNNDC